jgi:hypothetical protein
MAMPPPAPPVHLGTCPPAARLLHARDRPLRAVRDASACRWLPPADAPASAPLVVDVAVTEFEQRTAALQALTTRPEYPAGVRVRPMFAPRIGEAAEALRADVIENGAHYVHYRTDVKVGRRLATIAATWRWPAGSPMWVYERARTLAARLVTAE